MGDIPAPALVGLLLFGLLLAFGLFRSTQERSPDIDGRDVDRLPPEDLRAKHAASLQKFLAAPGLSHGDVAGLTIDFLRSVLAEGLRPAATSRYHQSNYYRSWVARTDLPSAVTDYGKFVYDQINARKGTLMKEAERERLANITKEATAIVQRNADKVSKFLEIAYRKVATVDEYGDENREAAQEEILRFLKKLGRTESALSGEDVAWRKRKGSEPAILGPISALVCQDLGLRFREYYALQKSKLDALDGAAIGGMTGVEFEQYLIHALKECGVKDVGGTPASGDQGADILFTHKGIRVAVQAKRYSGSVGNKAVQEVHAAKGYYQCARAWVVTNSTFTTSAKSLARQLDVLLVDGTDLRLFRSKFDEYFEE